MASFEDLYKLQQGGNNPLFNVQQMQANTPRWLGAPTPQNNNVAATRLFADVMSRPRKMDQGQQSLDIQRQRATDLADIQMQTFQAEMARNKQAQEARKNYAEANPEFAADIMAGKDPTTFQREMELAGGDPAKHRELFGPRSGPLVTVGGEPSYKVPANYMLNDPGDPSKGVVPIPGGPGEKRSGETAGKEAMIDVARAYVPMINSLVFAGGDPEGEINRDVLFGAKAAQYGVPGAMVPEGSSLSNAMETGIQAITRIETGAAMPPEDIANTRKRFEPSPMDSSRVIRQKLRAFNLFLTNAKEYLDPSGKVDFDKIMKDAEKKDSPEGIEVDQSALDAELKRRGMK